MIDWNWKNRKFKIETGWYDGPLLAIWIGPFVIDLSYTRIASWFYKDE